MISQRTLINFNRHTTPLGDIDNMVGYACVESGEIWEISIIPS